jgi:sugar phosphate isomerase/epimerase
MPASQIAAQLYTLRDFTKTPADIAKTLRRVKQIGYDAVQVSALGPIDPKELAAILRGEGLTCCATHTSLDRMKNDTPAVIDEHRLWNCNQTAIGGFFPVDPTFDDWRGFARDYSAIATRFAGSGISIGYHNHSHELAHYDGRPVLDYLIEELPKEVWFEIDTYWITHGGGDPVEWIGKVAGRIPNVHLKDMVVTPKREQRMAEVGAGNLNWGGILPACKAAGVQWYIVEQDETYGVDPFDCLATSLRNLKAMGLH